MVIKVSQTVADQLELIRSSGVCNMLDYNCVHRNAFDLEYYDLVTWMAENKKAYVSLIFEGLEVE